MLVLIIVFLDLHVQSHPTLVTFDFTFNGKLMSILVFIDFSVCIALIAIITWSFLYSATAFALGFE